MFTDSTPKGTRLVRSLIDKTQAGELIWAEDGRDRLAVRLASADLVLNGRTDTITSLSIVPAGAPDVLIALYDREHPDLLLLQDLAWRARARAGDVVDAVLADLQALGR